MKGRFRIVTVVVVVLFGIALAEASDEGASTARKDYERVIKEIEVQKKREQHLRQKEKSLLDELDRLAYMRNSKSRELRLLQKEASRTAKAVSRQEEEMRRLRSRMAGAQEQIKLRAAALYRISRLGPWAFLFSGENYSDFLRMSTFLYSMVDHDVRLFTAYADQLERHKVLQRKLKLARNRLEKEQEVVLRRKREIQQLEREQKKALKKIQKEKAAFAGMIRDLEKQAEKLSSLIRKLSAQTTGRPRKVSGFAAERGKLPLPVAGKIQKKRQTALRGISLKAPPGALVRAVYRGRVVYAGWFKGYGNLLIIDHGGKFHTVMANASELLKEKDEWVEAGEPVARVGSTGSLGGPSLYFEIRKDGVPVSPLEWFSREDRLALK